MPHVLISRHFSTFVEHFIHNFLSVWMNLPHDETFQILGAFASNLVSHSQLQQSSNKNTFKL